MHPDRLLVVDDSLTIRRALEFILKPKGYALEFAADGREALDRAAAFQPHLILLDYVLPDMRGPDVCSALSAIPATVDTPVILVSAKGASIRQAYQDAQNVVSYITKPFKPQVVLSVVENALARERSLVEAAPQTRAQTDAPEAESTAGPRPPATSPELPLLRAATLEETFSALLGQLEDAVSAETRFEPGAPRTLARLGDPLRRAREQLGEIGQHLDEDSVSPYRLRPDGSFANIASTLLETHRLLCEATLALARAGAPGPELPTPPEAILVAPADHPTHAALEDLAAARSDVLLIDQEFASLPSVLGLMQPQLLVCVAGADAVLDQAIGQIETLPDGRIALATEPVDEAAWSSFDVVSEVAAVAEALGHADTEAPMEATCIGLEVVSL